MIKILEVARIVSLAIKPTTDHLSVTSDSGFTSNLLANRTIVTKDTPFDKAWIHLVSIGELSIHSTFRLLHFSDFLITFSVCFQDGNLLRKVFHPSFR